MKFLEALSDSTQKLHELLEMGDRVFNVLDGMSHKFEEIRSSVVV